MNTTALIPIIIASSRVGSCGGGSCEIGLFGKFVLSILIWGVIGLFSYMAWEFRDEKFTIIFVSFLDLILFLFWIGIIWGLS